MEQVVATDRRDAPPRVRITVLEADGDTAWTRSIADVPDPIPAAEADSIWGERITSFQRFAQVEGQRTADDARQAYRASVPVPSHWPPVESVAMSSDGRSLLVWSAAPGQPQQAWTINPRQSPGWATVVVDSEDDLVRSRVLRIGLFWNPYLPRFFSSRGKCPS